MRCPWTGALHADVHRRLIAVAIDGDAGRAARGVAHLALGDARIVEIVCDGEGGHCRVRPREMSARDKAICCLAGYVCEVRILYGPTRRLTPHEIAAHMHLPDLADAARVLGDDPAALCDAWDEAATLIDRHWPAVLAIADRLAVTGRVDGAEAELIWRTTRRSA